MSERAHSWRMRARTAASLSALAILQSACSSGSPADKGKANQAAADIHLPPKATNNNSNKISACFQKPLEINYPYSTNWFKALFSDPRYSFPHLTVRLKNGRADGDPGVNRTLVSKAAKSVVKINLSDFGVIDYAHGSGFLATDTKGKQVVITAGHVAGEEALQSIAINAADGESMHPTGGCYIFQDNMQMLNPQTYDSPADTDVAVLTLPKAFKEPSLQIADRDAARGSWLTFINYQTDHAVGAPASYTGLTLTGPYAFTGYSVLTAVRQVHAPVTQKELNNVALEPGASGGPVLNSSTSKVEGISTAGDKNGFYEDKDSLGSVYNLSIPGAKYGSRFGFVPVDAVLMSVEAIDAALRAAE